MMTRRVPMMAMLACATAISACSGLTQTTPAAGAWVDCVSLGCTLVTRPLVVGECYLTERSYADPLTRHKEHRLIGLHVDTWNGTTLVRQFNGEAVATSIELPGLSIATGSGATPRQGVRTEYLSMWVRDDRSWIPIVTPPVWIDHCFVESDEVHEDERHVVLRCVGSRFPADWRATPFDDEIVATLTLRAGLLAEVEWFFDDGAYSGNAGSGYIFDAPDSHLRISYGSELYQRNGATETVHTDNGFPTLHVGCSQEWGDPYICEYHRHGGTATVHQRSMFTGQVYATMAYFARGDTIAAGTRWSSTSTSEYSIRRVPCDSIPPMDEAPATTE